MPLFDGFNFINMSKLFVVPTPIGNLEDITLRAIKVLENADIIFAEDTRTSSVLLNHFGIKKPLRSFHKFNEHGIATQVAAQIASGVTVALISDAGTPGISDPGYLLVHQCVADGIEVETLPGATAFIPALVNSGFPTDKFCFEGFLPQKKGKTKRLTQLSQEPRTVVFYESPHRLLKTLEMIHEIFEHNPQLSVSREISKKFEETVRGTAEELIAHFTEQEPKGEFVVVIKGRDDKKE